MFRNKRAETTELVLLSIVAIVAIVGLVLLFAKGNVTGSAVGDPVTKIVDVDQTGVFYSEQPQLCNENNNAIDATLRIAFTLWSNDHFVQRVQLLNGKIVDLVTGDNIGTLALQEPLTMGTGSLPFTSQQNLVVTCKGSGKIISKHFGIFIDENGEVHVHS